MSEQATEIPTPEITPSASAPSETDEPSEVDRLRAELAEMKDAREKLDAERAERECQEAIDALVRRYDRAPKQILQSLAGELPMERLETLAAAIHKAVHEAANPPGQGRGGLNPGGTPAPATWATAFRRHNEARLQGRTQTAFRSGDR